MQYLVSVIDDTAGLATPDEMAASPLTCSKIDVFSRTSLTVSGWGLSTSATR